MSYIKFNSKAAEVETVLLSYKDDKYFIAELPEFKICTWAPDEKTLDKSIVLCLEEFFNHWSKLNKLDHRLKTLGWVEKSREMFRKNPSEDILPIQIPKNLLLNKSFKTVSRKASVAYC